MCFVSVLLVIAITAFERSKGGLIGVQYSSFPDTPLFAVRPSVGRVCNYLAKEDLGDLNYKTGRQKGQRH